MISLFLARGHIDYAKCERLHFQRMFKVKMNILLFMTCLRLVVLDFHTVRGSNHFWVGI